MKKLRVLPIVLMLLLALLAPVSRPRAAPLGMVGGQDVLAAINALRQSQGLQPYAWSSGIAAYAQEHSKYQASIGQWTHTHKNGGTALSDGYVENIAAGNADLLTAQTIVYEIWADAIHMKTMVGYASGSAGVGVASDGATVYVTLNVRLPEGEVTVPTLPGGTPGSGVVYTPIALVPLRTATPKASGAVIHDVGYGQSLWAIAVAYGVSGDRIRALNGMAPGQSDIYAGQRLLIIPAGSITPPAGQPAETTPTAAQITPFPTSTRTPTRTLLPTPTLTPTPAPKQALGLKLPKGVDPILLGLIGMAVLGLALFLGSGIKIRRV